MTKNHHADVLKNLNINNTYLSVYSSVVTTRTFFMKGVLASRLSIENCPCDAERMSPSSLPLSDANFSAVMRAFLVPPQPSRALSC